MNNLFQSLKNGTMFVCNSIFKVRNHFLISLKKNLKKKNLNLKQPELATQTRNLGYINRWMLRDLKRRETVRKLMPERLRLKSIKTNTILPKVVKVRF